MMSFPCKYISYLFYIFDISLPFFKSLKYRHNEING